jgi:hypothetical protein
MQVRPGSYDTAAVVGFLRVLFVAEPNRMPSQGILFHIISSARREDTVAAGKSAVVAAGKKAAVDNKAGRT